MLLLKKKAEDKRKQKRKENTSSGTANLDHVSSITMHLRPNESHKAGILILEQEQIKDSKVVIVLSFCNNNRHGLVLYNSFVSSPFAANLLINTNEVQKLDPRDEFPQFHALSLIFQLFDKQ